MLNRLVLKLTTNLTKTVITRTEMLPIDQFQSSSDDIEDDLPFVCDQCNKVFKTLPWFTKHMEAGVHRAPAVSMKQFVAKHMQFHVGQSKQVTSMHFKMERVDKDVERCKHQQLWKVMFKMQFPSSRAGQGNPKGNTVWPVCLRLNSFCGKSIAF